MLPLAGLEPEQASELARKLLGPRLPEGWLRGISRESRGHPLFLTVLARFAESHDLRATSDLTLDAALGARLGNLSREAQRIVHVVALASAPLSIGTAMKAAEVSEASAGELIAELCQKRLLRRRRATQLACFHDQVRRVAVERLVAHQIRALHGKLARAFDEEGTTDPGVVARHYEAAGDGESAFARYRDAAHASLAGFAFARAVALFTRALELAASVQITDATRLELMVARGDALARAGRSAEAAAQYLDAVPLASGERKVELRTSAAQHLLQSAQLEQGIRAARELLRELDAPIPESKKGMLWSLAWHRTMLRVRGLEAPPRPTPLSPADLLRANALRRLVLPLNLLDPLSGAVSTAKYTRISLQSAEDQHLASTLASEASIGTVRGMDATRVSALLARARMHAQKAGAADAEARVLFSEGASALLVWDVEVARERLEQAERLVQERCPDQPFLLTNTRMLLGFTRFYRGEHVQLVRYGAGWLAEARDRNDRFALAALEGMGSLYNRHLMADDPDLARAQMEEVMRPWPREPFSYAHHGELLGVVSTELYRGGAGAHEWLEREAPRLERAFVLRMPSMRSTPVSLDALALLAAWIDAPEGRREPLLQRVRHRLARLKRLPGYVSRVRCGGISCMLAALEGRSKEALHHLASLKQASERPWFTAAFEYLEGVLEGGELGREKRERSLSFVQRAGWTDPYRALVAQFPVLPLLEAKPR